MNVMLISPYFRPAVGGVETHLDDLCKYLETQKHTVYVRAYKALGMKNRGATNENTKYVRIHRMWWPDFGLVFKLEPFVIPRILYIATGLFFDNFFFLLLNSRNVDVIQVHGFITALYAPILSKLFKKKLVINTHVGFNFPENSPMNKILKIVLNRSDEVLVLTKGAKDAVVKLGVDEEKIKIYHYWVDKNIFKPQMNARKKYL